jgi:hypothetical protein
MPSDQRPEGLGARLEAREEWLSARNRLIIHVRQGRRPNRIGLDRVGRQYRRHAAVNRSILVLRSYQSTSMPTSASKGMPAESGYDLPFVRFVMKCARARGKHLAAGRRIAHAKLMGCRSDVRRIINLLAASPPPVHPAHEVPQSARRDWPTAIRASTWTVPSGPRESSPQRGPVRP